ncbi:S-adenosyl-L-methionine-dependent methyltransferase [Stachybotrys elegans]|uniref:type I protein arginine methyltransferase n=1 Tax=Stachybotrys elegans TaxID=80388 RepID=A0A8K0WS85_9HYPO|nr:S-adenosyl-L-methionine-dependent methyltransferase [Stachybotrys elegans]
MSLSSISSSSDEGEGEWLDMEPDEESVTVTSLFDAQTFPSAAAMLANCKEKHEFDLIAVIRRHQLDFHGAVKLVNFVRHTVKEQRSLPADIKPQDFEDDRFLHPVLENDALLFSLDEILESDEGDSDGGVAIDNGAMKALSARTKEIEAELEAVRNQFANYRLAVEQTLDRRWGDDTAPETSGMPSTKKNTHDYYFESYAEHDIHETMLKDKVRTDAYRDFIYGNKDLFKDKVVLDIGCGTGILSMFCAKAGAARVIAVDKSDIITKARENIFHNGLSDVITCLRGAIEDVTLPVDKVDVIVSEWMGYCLLYEAMLPSVLYARDKYLKSDGILAPSSATMWIAPLADPEYISDHITYWRDVYGFDMKAMQEGIYEDVRVQTMPQSSICGKPYPFRVLDLRTVKAEDLVFTASWRSELNRQVDRVDGYLLWFDNFFDVSPTDPVPDAETTPESWKPKHPGNVAFTTGPFGTETHWRQGLLLTSPDDVKESPSPSCQIEGDITFAVLQENVRALTISASWTLAGQEKKSQVWKLK